METVEQVEALPEVVAEVEAGLPGSPAVAAAASWLLPAAPIESGPAAASAGTRSCEQKHGGQLSHTKDISSFLKEGSFFMGEGVYVTKCHTCKNVTKSCSCFQFMHDTIAWSPSNCSQNTTGRNVGCQM